MSKFSTYTQLVSEEKRLQQLLSDQKAGLLGEWQNTKEQLKPFENTMKFLSKVTTKNENNPLLNLGIDLGVDVLIRRWLLGNAGFLTKLLVPMVIRNYSSNVISSDSGNGLFGKIRNLFKKHNKLNAHNEVPANDKEGSMTFNR